MAAGLREACGHALCVPQKKKERKKGKAGHGHQQKEVPGCCHAAEPMPTASAGHEEKKERGGLCKKECKIRTKTQSPKTGGAKPAGQEPG